MSLLYLGVGRSLFIGQHPDQEMHHHSTLQITFSLSHRFDVRTHALPWTRVSGVAIDSNIEHQFKGFRGTGVSLHVVPEARFTRHLDEGFLAGNELRLLDPQALAPYVRYFGRVFDEPRECSEVFLKCEGLIEDLTGKSGYRGVVDERVLAALDRIESELPRRISLKLLAHHVCLSEDRFLHLFTQQLGLPLRPYILNQRILRATTEVLTGRSITQAAVNAGFSDTAHFSRTFLRLTGVHPTVLKDYRGMVRISSCGSSRCIRPSQLDPAGSHCLSCILNRPLSTPQP